MVRLTRNNKNNTNAKKEAFLRLLSVCARYIKCKKSSIYKKIMKKEPKKLKMKYIIKKTGKKSQ